VRHSRGPVPGWRWAGGRDIGRDSYALVKAPHRLGHDEPREITIGDYRREQGLPEYGELARG
jgi:hypothetical protein